MTTGSLPVTKTKCRGRREEKGEKCSQGAFELLNILQ